MYRDALPDHRQTPIQLLTGPELSETNMLPLSQTVTKMPVSCDYNCDSTTTRLRRIAHGYRTSIRREQKMNMSIFCRSRIAAESDANRNFDHFRRGRMHRGIVVS